MDWKNKRLCPGRVIQIKIWIAQVFLGGGAHNPHKFSFTVGSLSYLGGAREKIPPFPAQTPFLTLNLTRSGLEWEFFQEQKLRIVGIFI